MEDDSYTLLVTDNKRKELLLSTFSSFVTKSSCENFVQKKGYGDDFIRILFKEGLDEYWDPEEYQEIGERQAILFAELPSAPEEKFYLSFEEFYNYVKKAIKKNYSGTDQGIKELLCQLKQTLFDSQRTVDYHVLESKEAIDQLMVTYFELLTESEIEPLLSSFSEKKGYGEEDAFIYFETDLTAEKRGELPQGLAAKQVLVELAYPAVPVNQVAYLDYATLYEYLVEAVAEILAVVSQYEVALSTLKEFQETHQGQPLAVRLEGEEVSMLFDYSQKELEKLQQVGKLIYCDAAESYQNLSEIKVEASARNSELNELMLGLKGVLGVSFN